MISEDTLERELSCGICLELYTDPLQLTCMHTFCSECLKQVLASSSNNKKLKCPDCRKTTYLGKYGLTSLKRNFKLGSIVDIYRQTLQIKVEKTQINEKAFNKDRCPTPPAEKDYLFINDVIFGTHQDVSVPYEPHILDDLWGTFRRTAGTGNIPSIPPSRLRPSAPPLETSLSTQDQNPSLKPPIDSRHVTSGVPPTNHALPRGVASSPNTHRRLVPLPRTRGLSPANHSRLEQWVPPAYLQDPPRPALAYDPVQLSANLTESLEESEWLDGSFDIASSMSSMSAAPPIPPRTPIPSRTSCQVIQAPALPPRANLPAFHK